MFTPILTLTREYIKTIAKPYIVVIQLSFLCVPRAIASARQAQIHSAAVHPTVKQWGGWPLYIAFASQQGIYTCYIFNLHIQVGL